MDKNKSAAGRNNNFEKMLSSISSGKKWSVMWFIILMAIYIGASVIVRIMSGTNKVIMVGDLSVPVNSFAGAFSAMSNICMIIITVYFGKPGFVVSLVTLLVQFPLILTGILVRHIVSSIPGLFLNLLTMTAVIIIYVNNRRIENYRRRITEQAVTDRLTGMPNRFACTELTNDLTKHGESFVLVVFDLNNFKSINDTMGFAEGNNILTELGARLIKASSHDKNGTSVFAARLEGDEFALVIRHFRTDEEISSAIKRIADELEQKITVHDCDIFLTASFGYAKFPTDTKSVNSLITYASMAMREVKRAGCSDRILRFSPELLKPEHDIEIERKIRNALENDLLRFALQPQFDIDHELRGFEALARLTGEDGKPVSPGEFIPVAEKFGLIDKVDLCVFRKSADFFGKLLKESGRRFTLSVNVSVRHLMKNGFLDEIKDIISSYGIPAELLEIEITESIMIDSAEKALKCINDIKEMGVKIAIDDFGTGYSSLSYLNRFPADLLKIDKSFIDTMNSSESSRKYVAAIISIGHIMNFDVISEGVELPEQLETLKSIGCDYIQGYIWGKPLPPEKAEELVMSAAKAE